MKFENAYFEDEVRSGFFVDALMKSCWAAQLEVLKEIDRICKKHHIQYFAEWGTLLGTIRHGGFIPWDDDMDISMKRLDYERFLEIAPKELPESYSILNYKSDDDYYDIMARVVNSSFVSCEPDFLDRFHNNPFASGVDIFPLDYVPVKKEEEDILRELVDLVKDVADGYGMGYLPEENLEAWLTCIEENCKQKIDRNGNIKNQLYKILCGLYAIYNEEESDRIALMPLYLKDGGCVYPKECYADSILMPFDVTTIPVPIGYDYILKHKYGDYMKNVRKGGGHDYPFYEKQNTFLVERGIVFPKYEYPGNLDTREKNPTFYENLEQKIILLGQVHEKLELLIKLQQSDVVLQLLQEIQNIAMMIGESIERKVGEGTEAVHCLEQYCEVVYRLHETLAENMGVDGSEVRGILDKMLELIIQSLDLLPVKKEVVFMPYRATQWKALESVWKSACGDEGCNVKVVPLPYYYKRRLGESLSEMQYDGDKFPEYVPITHFSEYSLENNHPDVIYIQNPYDDWNHNLTVHEKYYSAELWKNTEQLIYIPWFKLDEMKPEDERALNSRKHFVPFPGVVHADKVIVQSEGMKQSYVDYLSTWAGEDTRPIWEEKILGLGSPLDDVESEQLPRPTEWGDRKVILYHISGNGLLEHKEKMLEKVERSMEVFQTQAEKVQVLWLQDAQMRQRLAGRIPKVFAAYEKLVQSFEKNPQVSVMPMEEEEKAVQLSDAFYGDAGKTAQAMKQLSKPVMLQNVEV